MIVEESTLNQVQLRGTCTLLENFKLMLFDNSPLHLTRQYCSTLLRHSNVIVDINFVNKDLTLRP